MKALFISELFAAKTLSCICPAMRIVKKAVQTAKTNHHI
jgi:hypothetical protein